MNAAFDTTMHTYHKGARTFAAPSTALTVPATLAGFVSGVVGLDQSRMLHTDHVQADKTGRPGDGCSAYYDEFEFPYYPKAPAPFRQKLSTPMCGYTPAQLARARQLPTAQTGRGVRVGITLWCNDPRIFADTNTWARAVRAKPLRKSHYTVLEPAGGFNSKYCDNQASGGTNVEQALDVQSIHGAAPAAHIVYSAARGPFDAPLIKALHALVDNNRVDVITDSWGDSPQPSKKVRNAYDAVFLQAAAQGISVLFSSGDNGDNSDGNAPDNGVAVDYPGSDPWITSVGGTTLATANRSGSKVAFEQGWISAISTYQNDSWTHWAYRFGGGGGTNTAYKQPFYQRGVVPTSYAGVQPKRVYPDLANVADPYAGYLIGYHDADSGSFTIQSWGGTSWASPYTAGTIALAQQAAHGRRVGFVNPLIYAPGAAGLTDIRGTQVTKGMQQDLYSDDDLAATVAFNAAPLLDQTLTIRRGYDNTTGMGAPRDTSVFVRRLAR